MSSQDILVIIIATITGLIYLLIIRKADIYEKEPFYKLLLVAIFGGMISIMTSLFLYRFTDVQHNFFDAIFKIGPIEESSKLLALMIVYFFIKSDFNEIVDGLVYIAAISLGFSIIENIFYAFKSSDPFLLLFQRSIFSVIGHLSFSGYLGVTYFIHKKVKRNFIGIILSIILASFAHGFYNTVLFHKELNFLFRFVFYGIIVLQLILVKIVLGFSTFRKEFTPDLFEITDRTVFLRCSKCNSSIKTKGMKFWKIIGVICNSCNSIVFQGENVLNLFKYFRPALSSKKYLKELSKDKEVKFLDDNEKVFYNRQRTILSSSVNDISVWLEESNKKDRQNIIDIPIIGGLLYYLGLRFITYE